MMIWLLCALPSVLAAPPVEPLSVHAEQLAHHPLLPEASRAAPLPDSPAPRPEVTVYGYHPYWSADPANLDFARLSHVAIFNVSLEADGSLGSTSHWTSVAAATVAAAHAQGTRVHLTVTAFDDAELNAVLPSSSRRAVAVSALAALVNDYGADGVNVDFEGMDASNKAYLVTFVEELKAEVDEVVLATPAVDWSGAYDYDALANASDGLFIMGYGYHWSGGDPGPVGPLFGGGPWSSYSLEWSVDDYLSNGAPADKIILGLPLYGREWPSSSHDIPGVATGTGAAIVMSSAMAQAAEGTRNFEEVSRTPYLLPSGTQLWYDDVDSTRERIAWSVDSGLQGVGFWALGYEPEGEGFWEMVEEETTSLWADTGGSGGSGGGGAGASASDNAEYSDLPIARAGRSFLAYPGETILLNGTGSTGPEGETLRYAWSQVGGPEVRLARGDTASPDFKATAPGTHTFSLVVSGGATDSEPDEVDVVVVDPTAGSELFDEGCASARAPATALLAGLALMLLGVRRRA